MYVVEKNVLYGHDFTEKLVADLYYPESKEKHSVILFIHGGGWKAGSKEMFQEYGPYLAESGFFAMSIDYRLSTPEKPTWPKVMDDVKQAFTWIVENASKKWNIDSENIFLIGESCGAQLAIMLALEHQLRDRIKAIIGVYGVYNVKDWWHYTRSVREDNPVGDFFGGSPDQLPYEYDEACPSARLTRPLPSNFQDVPFLLMWGDADSVVLPSQSSQFSQQLQELGNDVETLILPDAGHYWFSILPWIKGGKLTDYPNDKVAPKLVSFIKSKQ